MLERRSPIESSSDISSTLADPDHLQPDRPKVNGKSRSPEPRRSPSPLVVNNVDDTQEQRIAKKPKKAAVINDVRRAPPVTVEEIQDVDMPLTSAPIRPSQNIEVLDQPEPKNTQLPTTIPQNVAGPSQNSNRSAFGTGKSSLPKEPSKLRFSYQPDVSGVAGKPSQSEDKVLQDPKEAAMVMAVYALPSYTFTFNATSTRVALVHVTERNAAKTVPVSSLPVFDFSAAPLPKKADVGTGSAVTAFDEPGQEKKSSSAGAGFNWAAAGMKPPTTVGATWTCSTCMLSNPATAVDMCTVCETPR